MFKGLKDYIQLLFNYKEIRRSDNYKLRNIIDTCVENDRVSWVDVAQIKDEIKSIPHTDCVDLLLIELLMKQSKRIGELELLLEELTKIRLKEMVK